MTYTQCREGKARRIGIASFSGTVKEFQDHLESELSPDMLKLLELVGAITNPDGLVNND